MLEQSVEQEFTTADVERALPGWRASGLPVEFDDVIGGWAEGDDAERMAGGCHYDYRAQVWVDGHDHAHCRADGMGELRFCGADLASCLGLDR